MLSQSVNLYKKLQKQYSRSINLDLGRIKKVLLKLENPHLKLKNPINVIGSDGKMSVLTSLKYFIESEKKNLNAFTSPHLYDVRHRFWLKNKFISLNSITKLKKIIEQTNLKLTLFELLTCVFILAAKKEKKISYNLIESGLLFKKDSTNLWNEPRAQIITNINYQHQEWVKPKTINEICKQKVGSLSRNTTIYIAPQEPHVLKIIKKILKKNPSKKIYSSNWKLINKENVLYYKDNKNLIPIKSNHILSKALTSNLCVAIKVALDLGIKNKTITKTIPKIKFEGRVHYVKNGKLKKTLYKNEKLLLDGCHSNKSAENLYDYLKTLNEPVYGIWGMQKNKLPKRFINSFNKIFKKIITIKIPSEPNSLSANKLKDIGEKIGYKIKTADNINQALSKISNNKKKTIVIFGSLYLVGDALRIN